MMIHTDNLRYLTFIGFSLTWRKCWQVRVILILVFVVISFIDQAPWMFYKRYLSSGIDVQVYQTQCYWIIFEFQLSRMYELVWSTTCLKIFESFDNSPDQCWYWIFWHLDFTSMRLIPIFYTMGWIYVVLYTDPSESEPSLLLSQVYIFVKRMGTVLLQLKTTALSWVLITIRFTKDALRSLQMSRWTILIIFGCIGLASLHGFSLLCLTLLRLLRMLL